MSDDSTRDTKNSSESTDNKQSDAAQPQAAPTADVKSAAPSPETKSAAGAEQPTTAAPAEKPAKPKAAATASDQADSAPADNAAPSADKASAAKPAAAAEKPAAAKPAAAPAEKAAAATDKPAAAAKPAAKPAAKKAPPPPDPRAVAAKEVADRIKATVTAALGENAVEETGAAHFDPMVLIKKEYWLKAVELLRTHSDWKLNYVELMAGTDFPNYIEVVIYVQSTELKHFVCLKTRTERERAEVPSIVPIFPGVNWEEREIYDLLGVTFTNHPDLRRIMMWDDFPGYPLRKDYSEWD